MLVDYPGLLAAIRERFDRSPYLIALSGHGGSGKSTVAANLADDLGGIVIGTDSLYTVGAGPESPMWELQDWATILRLLRNLRTADRVVYRERWYTGEEFEVDEPLPSVVVLEGIRVIRPEVLALVDASIWLDCPADVAGERAKARNRLQGDDQSEIDLWDNKWVPEGLEYERLIQPATLADFVMSTSDLAGLEIPLNDEVATTAQRDALDVPRDLARDIPDSRSLAEEQLAERRTDAEGE